jgi:hypothetical protein
MKLLPLFFLLLLVFAGCQTNYWPETIETGFEDFEQSGDSLFVKVGDTFLSVAGTIDSVAMEGSYSLKAAASGSIAMDYRVDKPKPDSKYLITCWTHTLEAKNSGNLVALINRNGKLIEIERQSQPTDSQNNWQMLELLVQLPPNHDGSSLVIRLENTESHPVWFDEFKLEFIDKVYYPEFDEEESLVLNISEPDVERLREMRLDAFEKGFIDMGKEHWIEAEILWRDSVMSAKVRFKGDNLKHLQGDKWSLTIDIEAGSVMGMRRFAIQTPEARSFLDEWLFHKVLQQEGLATSKYSFAPVVLNDRSLGVYALVEDQRDEEFLERYGKGAVLRFNDVVYWQNIHSKSSKSDSEVLMEAPIQSMAGADVPKSAIRQFEMDIQRFRAIDGNTAALFNAEKTTRMLAVCDVMEAYNALHWVNVRFYGSAKTGLLEFIGHDGFSKIETFSREKQIFMAYTDQALVEEPERLKAMYLHLFNDTLFLSGYLNHLNRMTEEKYFNVLKLNTLGEMKYYRDLLMKEWPHYRFDYLPRYNRARIIQKRLKLFEDNYRNATVKYQFIN